MSREYVEEKIKEALVLSHGNQARARKVLMDACTSDNKLLQFLTRPHLMGIISYNVERVASGRSAKAEAVKKEKASTASQNEGDFGAELLKAVAGNSGDVFGLESGRSLQKRAKVSQSHIDALQMMASKSQTKK